MDRGFLAAGKDIERAVDQGHPFPDRAVRVGVADDDLVEGLASLRVDELARLVVGQVEDVGGGDHGVAMDHEAFGERAGPEDRAVVGVDAEERVELLVLVFLVGNMPACPEDPPAGGHGDLGHGREHGAGQELGQIGSPGQLVGRLRVVVGRVVGVAPGVGACRESAW